MSPVNIGQRINSIDLPLLLGTAQMAVLAMHVDSAARYHFWTSSSLARLRFSDVVEVSVLARHEIALETPMMSLPSARDLRDVSLSSCLSYVNMCTS